MSSLYIAEIMATCLKKRNLSLLQKRFAYCFSISLKQPKITNQSDFVQQQQKQHGSRNVLKGACYQIWRCVRSNERGRVRGSNSHAAWAEITNCGVLAFVLKASSARLRGTASKQRLVNCSNIFL